MKRRCNKKNVYKACNRRVSGQRNKIPQNGKRITKREHLKEGRCKHTTNNRPPRHVFKK